MPSLSDRLTLTQTPEEKQILAKILFDSSHSISQVCKRVGISNHTAIAIKRRNDYSATLVEEYKRRLPMKAYRLADDTIDLITLQEIQKAPLGVKMMAFGVAIDKARDMEGSNRPIFNIVSVINECKQTRDRLEAQLSGLSQRKLALSAEQTNTVVIDGKDEI